MIYAHSVGCAAGYYPDRLAVCSGATRLTFRDLHGRVARIATALSRHGFGTGDRLALLLPNEVQYLELVYACAWLGVIIVPLNTQFSPAQIDRVLADASPQGLLRHSSFPAPTVNLRWQRVLDQEPLDLRSDSAPEAVYDPGAVLALVYSSESLGHPQGVILTHAATLANVHHINYWMPYHEGGVYLHSASMAHIADFPFMFAAPAFGASQGTLPIFNPEAFCEIVQRERVSYTVLVSTMINLLTQFPDLPRFDLGSLKQLGYGGSPLSPEVIHRTQSVFPNLQLTQVFGLSETGFLTALQDPEHTPKRRVSWRHLPPGINDRQHSWSLTA
jgi:long-chain acyl-CoA synthetase